MKRKPYITEGHLLLERIGYLLLLGAFAVCAEKAITTGGKIATHFDIHGTPDGYGSPLVMLILPLTMLAVNVLISVLIRKLPPEKMNMPFEMKPENADAVMTEVSGMLFWLEIEMAAFALAEVLMWSNGKSSLWNALMLIAALLLTIVWSTVRMVKANKRTEKDSKHGV